MTYVKNVQARLAAIAKAELDRRRPGRPETVSPVLVEMLRAPTADLTQETLDVMAITDLPVDDQRVAKGLSMAALFSSGLWVLIAGALWLVSSGLARF